MATERARLLLHPVRMRIVIALSAQQLTTRHMQQLMPDVPQASLYRAISQLAAAGIIEVVSQERRGGAMERTYRMAAENDAQLTSEDLDSSGAEEALGVVQALADMMVTSTSRYLSEAGDDWSQACLTVRHAPLWLTDDERAQLTDDILQLFASYQSKSRGPESRLHALQVAAVPEVGPPDVCPGPGASDQE
ncbi:helix-turn-helix domain-containing protein [Demequina sp. SO4-13]|uniref:helix-turn-helix domain-containing protein n=1 Tax=Demequina sp. SO4-13 TaxID=3401027 RepID=UPI003AF8896F